MKITESQLRKIVREAVLEEILEEKKRPKPKVTLWNAIRNKRKRGESPARECWHIV